MTFFSRMKGQCAKAPLLFASSSTYLTHLLLSRPELTDGYLSRPQHSDLFFPHVALVLFHCSYSKLITQSHRKRNWPSGLISVLCVHLKGSISTAKTTRKKSKILAGLLLVLVWRLKLFVCTDRSREHMRECVCVVGTWVLTVRYGDRIWNMGR